MHIIRARYLIPMTETNDKLDRIEDGYVLFSDTIEEVGEYTTTIGQRIIDQYQNQLEIIGNQVSEPTVTDIIMINGVIMPGFVKTHGHDHESAIIGVAKDVPLTTWLDEAVNPFSEFLHNQTDELHEKLGQSPYILAYTKARVDDISFGITTALTHHCNFNKYHVDELVEANNRVGTHLFIAIGSQDRNYYNPILDTVSEAIERLDRYYDKYKDWKRVHIIPGPDQLFSNGPELLKALKHWARNHNSLLHIHSSEELNTTNWFKEEYGMSPIEYADSVDLLDQQTMLAHQVNSTKSDIRLIAKHHSLVVHNPLANTILGSGMPPVLDMINAGIDLSISTDGSGSADCQNMLGAARLASQYQKALHQDATLLDAEDVLKRVTTIPAQMLGINAGSIEIGKAADIIVLDLNRPNLIPSTIDTVIENLIWASAGNEIPYVIADGKVLVNNYDFTTVDMEQLGNSMLKLAHLYNNYKQEAVQIKGTGVNR